MSCLFFCGANPVFVNACDRLMTNLVFSHFGVQSPPKLYTNKSTRFTKFDQFHDCFNVKNYTMYPCILDIDSDKLPLSPRHPEIRRIRRF